MRSGPPAPAPSALSVSDAAAVEGGTLRFQVTLTPAATAPATVGYRTAGGTAVAGTDYEAASGTLTFAPGTTRQTIEVPTREDEIDEPNEQLTVTLSAPSGATLKDAVGLGTITDDDPPAPAPSALSVSDAAAVEGGTLRFQVTLTPAAAAPATVGYRTAGGTAVAGTDYEAASGTLTFAPGTTRQTIEVPTREDEIDEPNEQLTVTLSAPSGATLKDAVGLGTITDDDPPAPAPSALSVSDAAAVDAEGGTLRFQVTLTLRRSRGGPGSR